MRLTSVDSTSLRSIYFRSAVIPFENSTLGYEITRKKVIGLALAYLMHILCKTAYHRARYMNFWYCAAH